MNGENERIIPKPKFKLDPAYLSFILVLLLISTLILPYKLSDPIPTLIMFVIIVLTIGTMLIQELRWRIAWKLLSQKLGLRYKNVKVLPNMYIKYPKLTGVYDGYPVTLQTVVQGRTRRYRIIYVFINIQLQRSTGENLGLMQKQEGIFNRKSLDEIYNEKIFISEVINTRFDVIASSPEKLKHLLAQPKFYQGIMELKAVVKKMRLTIVGDSLTCSFEGPIQDNDFTQAGLNFLIELASFAENDLS